MSYSRLIEKLWTQGRPSGNYRISLEWAADTIEHPDFDLPGIMATSPTGRVMFVVEGEKELVYPIIEKANEIVQAVGK